ncbi:DUF3105 domain-containing protein [Cryobacterium adonitolivorans]|uniref:DUF3105 domain-containing protein n=1 Tax=Cryobacterium adonitolivorans TaxID=1259189 RepID=A0A4R8W2E3_9MICO|nr:DUF3105 domain-containing protein [Cryobacterium adonitolivorans]TFC00975.1 DUF3105 domain-containing protein [Cryobacterium adonitolivorans]
MQSKSKRKLDRQAIVAEARGKMKKDERRRKILFLGSGAVLIAGLLATVGFVVFSGPQAEPDGNSALGSTIDGVESFSELSRDHVLSTVAFPELPPVGGDHSEDLTNCGVYTQPVDTWRAVHSLEHGAVWVTYQSDLPAPELEVLTSDAAVNSYEILSPYPDLPAPIIATAWGKRLQVDSAGDPRLSEFLATYLQGPQTPEPGAPCSGGVQG